jgi:hypothetical protein
MERAPAHQHSRCLKPKQALKMQNLSVVPTRWTYKPMEKPDVASERPILRSAHDIFSDPALSKHKQWTRTAPAAQVNVARTSKPTTGDRIRAHAKAVHSVQQTRRRPSSASLAVVPTGPIRLQLHEARHTRPQSARADSSATNVRANQNPSPPRIPTPGRAVRSARPAGRRIQKPGNRTITTMPNDHSTFGGIQQRGGRFGQIATPTRLGKQDRRDNSREANVARWWVEEQSRTRQRCQTARDGETDRPAWDTSISLAM